MSEKMDSVKVEHKIKEMQWDIDFEGISNVIDEAKSEKRNILLENEAREVLGYAGIPMAKGKVVDSLDGAVKAAEEIGYPVVLKVVSEDVIHKVDVGGIAVNLEDQYEVEEAYQSIHSHVKNRKPEAKIRGISVAEMVEGGEEVVIGGMIDPSFGPVVMFGLGGIYVEILKDVVFRIAPLTKDEAQEMLLDIKTYPVLLGARGKKRRDLKSLAEIISRVGYLMYKVKEINDIDLNPVAALEKGAKALDVAISLK